MTDDASWDTTPPATVEQVPAGLEDTREVLLGWLAYLRGAVVRNLADLTDEQGGRRPEGRLLPLAGIVNHLTHVEWRWIDGGMLGRPVHRSEAEFDPGPRLGVAAALAAYRGRAAETEAIVRSLPLDAPCQRAEGKDLHWVLLHLINETARHAGHADATRELLDGATGE